MLPYYDADTRLSSIKLVASDMDCTLLADDGTLPPSFDRLVDRLADAGIVFCAASGRPRYTLREMFAGQLDKIALMSDNGAAIAYRDEIIYKSLMAPEDVRALLDFTLADGRGCPTVCSLEACYIRSCDRIHDGYFRKFFTTIRYVDSLEDLDAEVNKYTVYFPEHDAEEVYATAYRDTWGERFHVTNAGREWIDIMNPGINKGSGLSRLCKHLGIDTADAAAFGDTYNDIQMLEAAGHGFVMANAEEHMHAHADFIAPGNNDRGVATVVEAILAAR